MKVSFDIAIVRKKTVRSQWKWGQERIILSSPGRSNMQGDGSYLSGYGRT